MTTNHLTAADIAAIEQDRHYEIDMHRKCLRDHIKDAAVAARYAIRALDELTGHLYDVEYAEGTEGKDVKANLEDAGRLLRSALALTLKPEEAEQAAADYPNRNVEIEEA